MVGQVELLHEDTWTCKHSSMTQTRHWTAYNAASCEEKRRFVALLADLCSGVPTVRLPGVGRPRLPLKGMLFAAAYKVYVGFSSRRFTSDLRDAFVDGHIQRCS